MTGSIAVAIGIHTAPKYSAPPNKVLTSNKGVSITPALIKDINNYNT